MEKIVVHVLETATLVGLEDACRKVIAPRYCERANVGPEARRLEALGTGLLARYLLGVRADEDLTLGEYGKPSVAGAPEFNLSNDAGLVVLAMGSVGGSAIGVDVEEVPGRYRHVEELLARKYYDADELAAIGDGSTHEGRIAYARAWTRREAILKAMGTGLAVDPRKHPEVLEGWELQSRLLGDAVLTCAMREPFCMKLVPHNASDLLDCAH